MLSSISKPMAGIQTLFSFILLSAFVFRRVLDERLMISHFMLDDPKGFVDIKR